MVKPNFFVVGVARCGTTSLVEYLKRHPEISFGPKKEPKFFSYLSGVRSYQGPGDHTVYEDVVKDYDIYLSLYKNVNTVFCGDGSSDTFYYSDKTISHIKRILGDIPIVVVLRNPVERVLSAYNNMIRDSRETLSLDEAIRLEQNRLMNGYDWMWHYTTASLYSERLELWQSEFSKVKVILNEDLKDNPKKVVYEVIDFLGGNKEAYDDLNAFHHYSTSGRPKSKVVAKIISRNGGFFFLRRLIVSLFPRFFLERVAKKILRKEKMSLKLRSELLKIFSSDIAQLELLIERDLSHWKIL